MEIDIKKAEAEFLNYVSKYDIDNYWIKLKREHSLRVMNISKQIATLLELSDEDIKIATLIGLLHDIARFEQYKQYNTFVDLDSLDHGDYGVEILNKDIRNYIKDDKYDNIIKTAIKNHNKFKVQEGLNKKEEMFCKIIRDADKIDIFFEAIDMFWIGEEEQINSSILDKNIYEEVKNLNLIDRRKFKYDRKGVNSVVALISFIFDMNYDVSLNILKQNKYIDKILDRFSFNNIGTKEQIENIRKIVDKYLNKELNEG